MKSKYNLESPEVGAILNNVWKSGVKTYYRIDDEGKHVDIPVRQQLVAALGISTRIATKLLQAADLPSAPFVHNATQVKPVTVAVGRDAQLTSGSKFHSAVEEEHCSTSRTGQLNLKQITQQLAELEDDAESLVEEEPEDPEDSEPEAFTASVNSEPVVNQSTRRGPRPISLDEREAKAAKAEAAANAKRYERIRQGGYYGIYDNESGSQELFHTEAESLAYLEELLHGRAAFKIYFSSPTYNSRRSEPINYND